MGNHFQYYLQEYEHHRLFIYKHLLWYICRSSGLIELNIIIIPKAFDKALRLVELYDKLILNNIW
jgi:hypothetical protein